MNDIQKNYIGWLLIMLLIVGHITINDLIFLRVNKQESKNSIKALSESIDDLKISLENNQSRLEKKIFDFKKTQCDQIGDGSVKYKNLAKSLLLIAKMKDVLLQGMKFSNHVNELKSLILELNDQDIENAVYELENVKEINTLHELKLIFERTIDTVNYNKGTLFKKIISNWIKVKNKNDPLRIKWAEIEDSIDENDWKSIDTAMSNFTHSEFKPWLNKLHDFVIVSKNISIIYNHLLQYIS